MSYRPFLSWNIFLIYLKHGFHKLPDIMDFSSMRMINFVTLDIVPCWVLSFRVREPEVVGW